MKKVVVIGGGITGLSTMYYLQKMKNEKNIDLELTLIESTNRLGGKISTLNKDGFVMERGADAIVTRYNSVKTIMEDLQLQDEAAYNTTGTSYIYTDNQLHQVPEESVFGIPMSKESLLSSTLVSEEGKKEALKDFETKNEHFTKESSVGEFLEAFLGKELVERQIAPILGGVFSGPLNELTLATTLPYLVDYKEQYGSIIEGLAANKEKFSASTSSKFLSFKDGQTTLIHKLEAALSEQTIMKDTAVQELKKLDSGYELLLSNGQVLSADHIIFATPQKVTQNILKDDTLNEEFSQFTNSSLISVYVASNTPDSVLPENGTGYIVSGESNVNCDACTWTSRKWEHTSKKKELLFRMFYKDSNSKFNTISNLNDDELTQLALEDIENSTGIKIDPCHVEITRWIDKMPNYHLQHGQLIESLQGKLATSYPNIHIAGCSYFGVGIGMCIQNGIDTAEKVVNNI